VHFTDVAMELFDKYRPQLATARDEQKLTALHILAKKPSEFLGKLSPFGFLFGYLCIYILKKKKKFTSLILVLL